MSSRVRQLSFFPRQSLEHGGDTRVGKRKIARPFDSKRSLHVVLKSKRARDGWSMLHGRHHAKVETLTRGMARRLGVVIDRRGYANVGSHLHLIVRAQSRQILRAFLRALGGAIAMLVTGTRKGHSQRASAVG